jgi:hypothetical protein
LIEALHNCRRSSPADLAAMVRQVAYEPPCCICDQPVALETAKTDERGRAVHEECYVLKLRLQMGPPIRYVTPLDGNRVATGDVATTE